MLRDGATVDLEQENRRLQAELQAQTQELRGSRARLVAVGDAQRRRLERDLHDGAQSRFAGVALHLRLAQRKAPPDSELASMLDDAIGELSSGIEELRELARGIHPAVLTSAASRRRWSRSRPRAAAGRLRVTLERPPPGGRSRRRPTSRSPRRSPTWSSTPERASSPSTSRVEHGRLVIEVADDGCGGAIRCGGRACAASPTASGRSTGASSSTAHPAAARACTSRSRAACPPPRRRAGGSLRGG